MNDRTLPFYAIYYIQAVLWQLKLQRFHNEYHFTVHSLTWFSLHYTDQARPWFSLHYTLLVENGLTWHIHLVHQKISDTFLNNAIFQVKKVFTSARTDLLPTETISYTHLKNNPIFIITRKKQFSKKNISYTCLKK